MMFDIAPTAEEQQELLDDILQRNCYRKNAQLPLIDVTETYAKERSLIRAKNFQHILRPYVTQALCELPRPCGLPCCIGTQHQAQMMAYERIIADYDCTPSDLPIPNTVLSRLLGTMAAR